MTPSVSAVLFARDAHRLARFYVAVFGAAVRVEDGYHGSLELRGFRLIIHQIPAHLAQDADIGTPYLRRESSAIRLDYPVADVGAARRSARQLGGQIDDQPPPWADANSRFHLGFDPEGNVFGVSDEH